MTSLDQLQVALQRYILIDAQEAVQYVARPIRGDRAQRLAIYREAYRLRLIEALAADYEGLRAYLGQTGFNAACLAYVEATPSSFRNLRWYGAKLADFLASAVPWSDAPVLAELARFEWTLTLAFDAPDAPLLNFAHLAALAPQAWETLSLTLHPSVRLLALRTNAAAIRQAHSAGESLPEGALADHAQDWLIWRYAFEPHFLPLPALEGWALRAAQAGASFSEICVGLCRWVPEAQAPAQAAGLLRAWVDRGLISAVVWHDQ